MIGLLMVCGVVIVSSDVMAVSTCTDAGVICLNGQIQNGDVLKVNDYTTQLENSAQHLILFPVFSKDRNQ